MFVGSNLARYKTSFKRGSLRESEVMHYQHRSRLLDYNEDDCRAIIVLLDAIRELA